MIEVRMPRLSDTMEEGAISVWRKKPGDTVEVGDVLVEIETDKAIMEYEAYEPGVLDRIMVDEGRAAPIGSVIATLQPPASTTPSPATPSPTTPSPTTPSPAMPVTASTATDLTEGPSPARLLATPLVRKLARQHGIDLRTVEGTGPGGRIVRVDVDALLPPAAHESRHEPEIPMPTGVAPDDTAVEAPKARPDATPSHGDAGQSTLVPLDNVRRVIVRRLGASAGTVPQFSLTAGADAEELVALRARLNDDLVAAGRPKVSINDLVIRACALALRRHPLVNASYVEDSGGATRVHHVVNIGVAVAADEGLVVPVIADADRRTVSSIGAETRELVKLAGERRLAPGQLSGATFTVSNLGMYGVEHFTALINPPEGAILAVGALAREPVVVGAEVVPRHRLRYTLSADHRIIDGALGARFLDTLTDLVQHPSTILV